MKAKVKTEERDLTIEAVNSLNQVVNSMIDTVKEKVKANMEPIIIFGGLTLFYTVVLLFAYLTI